MSAQERPSLTVDVTGAQVGVDRSLPDVRDHGVRSGTVGRQALVVPTGEAIRFNLSSVDVIHSFWIPELDFKRDAIPGATESVTLSFARAGVFPGQCAEFCGLRHADMVFTVHAVSPAQFRAWAAGRRQREPGVSVGDATATIAVPDPRAGSGRATSTDHKRIGLNLGIAALAFFLRRAACSRC